MQMRMPLLGKSENLLVDTNTNTNTSSTDSTTTTITMNINTPAGELNTYTWYRLSNSIPNHSLDIINLADNPAGKPQLRPTGNYSGQFWRLRQIVQNDPSSEADDLFSLETMYLGPERRLDVYGNDPTKPHLATRGEYYGQRWMIEKWPGSEDEFKLANTYGGFYLVLDTRDGREVLMSPSDRGSAGTQRWKFTPARPIRDDEDE